MSSLLRCSQYQQLHEQVVKELTVIQANASSAHVTSSTTTTQPSPSTTSDPLPLLLDTLRQELAAKDAELLVYKEKEQELIQKRQRLEDCERSHLLLADEVERLTTMNGHLLEDVRHYQSQNDSMKNQYDENYHRTLEEYKATTKDILDSYRGCLVTFASSINQISSLVTERIGNDVEQRVKGIVEALTTSLKGVQEVEKRVLDRFVKPSQQPINLTLTNVTIDLHRLEADLSQCTSAILDYRAVQMELIRTGQLLVQKHSVETRSYSTKTVVEEIVDKGINTPDLPTVPSVVATTPSVAYEMINRAFQELEKKFSAVLEDSRVADEVVTTVVEVCQQIGITFTSFGDAAAPTTSTQGPPFPGEHQLTNLLQHLSFQAGKREQVYRRLVQGIQGLVRSLMTYKHHCHSLQSNYLTLQEEHDQAKESFERLEVEAQLAVQVSTDEVQRSQNLLQLDYQRKYLECEKLHQQQLSEAQQICKVLVDKYREGLLVIHFLLDRLDDVEQRGVLLRDVHVISQKMLRGYTILANDVKMLALLYSEKSKAQDENLRVAASTQATSTNNIISSLPKSELSFKSAALVVLAANRLRSLLRVRREKGSQRISELNYLEKKSLLVSGTLKDLDLFVNFWTFPNIEEIRKAYPSQESVDGIVHYLRHLLSVRGSTSAMEANKMEKRWKASSSLIERISRGFPKKIDRGGYCKELYGQKELNDLHAGLLQLFSQRDELFSQKDELRRSFEDSKQFIVETERRADTFYKENASLRVENSRLQADLEEAHRQSEIQARNAAFRLDEERKKYQTFSQNRGNVDVSFVNKYEQQDQQQHQRRRKEEKEAEREAAVNEYEKDGEQSLLKLSRSFYREKSNSNEEKVRVASASQLSTSQTQDNVGDSFYRTEQDSPATPPQKPSHSVVQDRRELINRLEEHRRDVHEDIETTARQLAHTRLSQRSRYSTQSYVNADQPSFSLLSTEPILKGVDKYRESQRPTTVIDKEPLSPASSTGEWSFRQHFLGASQTDAGIEATTKARNISQQSSVSGGSRYSTPQRMRDAFPNSTLTSATQTPNHQYLPQPWDYSPALPQLHRPQEAHYQHTRETSTHHSSSSKNIRNSYSSSAGGLHHRNNDDASRDYSRQFDDSFVSTQSQSHNGSRSSSRSRESTSSRFLRIHNAERAKNELKDMELLEIYSDIGRLTGRLESRLRQSHSRASSPEHFVNK
eukprot:scaffold3532_cov182-Ochromonas_danica.AAC.12